MTTILLPLFAWLNDHLDGWQLGSLFCVTPLAVAAILALVTVARRHIDDREERLLAKAKTPLYPPNGARHRQDDLERVTRTVENPLMTDFPYRVVRSAPVPVHDPNATKDFAG